MMSYARSIVLGLFQRFRRGRLLLELPEGGAVEMGEGGGLSARITLKSNDFFERVFLQGDVGFGESYVAGDWETPDLAAVISWAILNSAELPEYSKSFAARFGFGLARFANRLGHLARRNSRPKARENIEAHYDLGNDFYRLFLDETMTYSAAVFGSAGESLASAQSRKYELLCRKIGLRPGDQVLEIGCGWGGFAEHAVRHHGVHVTGLTLSPSQLDYAKRRLKAAGLSDRAEFHLRDYRDEPGRYDKVVSIEMIEAVGHEFLPEYFRKIDEVLKPNGVAGLQAIIFPDAGYDTMRKSVDWIQKHIFPGGLLPSLGAISGALRSARSNLFLHHCDTFGQHYARTLALWRERYNRRLPEAEKLGFDATFHRKWNYYFCYCEAAFRMRHINLAQLVLARPHNLSFATETENFQVLPDYQPSTISHTS